LLTQAQLVPRGRTRRGGERRRRGREEGECFMDAV
jgi:hypothetical protein